MAQRSPTARPHHGHSDGREYDKELPYRAVAGIALMRLQTVGGRRAACAGRARIWQSQGGDAERGQEHEDTGAKAVHDMPVMLFQILTVL